MQVNDLINGLFELVGGLLGVINIVSLVKDKAIKGVSWIPANFFMVWSAWNLYYYPSLKQPISFIGGIGIFLSNGIWIYLVFYYKYKK